MKNNDTDPKKRNDGDISEIRGSTTSNPREDQEAKKDKENQSAQDAKDTTDDD